MTRVNGSNIYDLQQILYDDAAAKSYLLSRRVFYESLECPTCGSLMSRVVNRWAFRCMARTCDIQRSLSSHTFFSGTALRPNQILLLARLWLSKISVSSAISLTGHSPNTVVKFWGHFRKLVASTLEESDVLIGGPDVIVEVDESKLGKRKYNRGHHVDGVWVVVGVERTAARRVFVVPVQSRDGGTLQEIVRLHVLPGSIIHTDLWKGYTWLNEDMDYMHRTVNHSQCFKDESTGVHTNFVEGTNNGLKQRIMVRSRLRDGIEGHLDEFVWRRKHEKEDLWERFIDALRDIHYDLE